MVASPDSDQRRAFLLRISSLTWKGVGTRRKGDSDEMNGKITYHQQVSYCGKPRCRRCREGTGHGPYWYAYQTINGRTVRTYVGKNPPAEALQGAAGVEERVTSVADSAADAVVRLYMLGQFTLERRERLERAAIPGISNSSTNRDKRSALHWQPVTDAALQHQRVR